MGSNMNMAYLRLTQGSESPGTVTTIDIDSTIDRLNAFISTFAQQHAVGEEFLMKIGGQIPAAQMRTVKEGLIAAFRVRGEVALIETSSSELSNGVSLFESFTLQRI
jgi:hypothetical protein